MNKTHLSKLALIIGIMLFFLFGIFGIPKSFSTQGLLASMPRLGEATRMRQAGEQLAAIPGVVPGLTRMPPGCAFAPRCPHAIAACAEAVPALETVGAGHASRCIRWREI